MTNRIIAVIGTAGRNARKPLTRELWNAMRADLKKRIAFEDTLVSGGAAWADHLAVDAFIHGHVGHLELYLPAPINSDSVERAHYVGSAHSAASASNYYHRRFSQVAGKINSISEIVEARGLGATLIGENGLAAQGYGSFFRRNQQVAERCNRMIAYTFSESDEPEDGGTHDTWCKALRIEKRHVSLAHLLDEI